MALIKTPAEIKTMKRAAKAAQTVFASALSMIRVGVTERDIARRMEELALELDGVSGLAFPPIVASGPNGAEPHAEVTDRVLESGDLVTVDFGVMIDGYASDMTRTFLLGPVTQELRKIYASVKRAQCAGLSAARAGIACSDLDAVCRDIIEKDGYGEYFIHTTGHGIGTEVHEDPRLGKNSEAFLDTGMVVTIEPGIYIEGLGGVRIEDTIVITKSGSEVITPLIPKNRIPITKLLRLI